MPSAPSSPGSARSLRSIHRFIPLASLLLLVLSRTILHHTRFEESTLGFGAGLLLAYVLGSAFPGLWGAKEPEANDLQTLDLSR